MITVRLQVLNGVWETVGSGRMRGIVAEGFQGAGDDKGPDTCTFSLRRLRGGGNFPDLSSFTPCEVERNGKVIWDGRVKGTPSHDGDDMAISVTGEGWQHHPDDDVFPRIYVHAGSHDWFDRRALTGAPLGSTVLSSQASVQNDQGTIVIMFPNGVTVASGDRAEVMFDAGPDNLITRVVWNFQTSNNNNGAPQVQVQARGMDSPDATGATTGIGGWTLAALTTVGAGPTTTAGTLSSPKRWFSFQMQWAAGGTAANDAWVRINTVTLFTKTAYESGNVSILKATDVIADALTVAPLISTDQSGIQTSTFSIPDFAPTGARTPREMIEAANAFEAWQYKIDLGRRPIYRPWPGSGVSLPLGPQNTATGADDTSIGTAAWTNPGNIASSDNVYATVALGNTVTSHYLKGTNCGFSQIPADAIITGIQLEVERSSSVNAAVAWQSVKIVKNGVVSGDEQIGFSLGWGTSDVIDTFGGPGNLWGLTWTGADIRASNFGAAVSASTGIITGTAQVDMMRITVYYRPSDTFAAAGSWPGVVFEDASLNDGSEIYNKVRVEYTEADGTQGVVTRTAAQQPAGLTSLVSITSPSFLNPSFDVDALNWASTAGGAVSRTTTTGEFDSAPGGGKWVVTSGHPILSTNLSGTFKAGVTYLLQSRIKVTAGVAGQIGLQASSGLGPIYVTQNFTGSGSFDTITFSWTPGFDTTSVQFALITATPSTWFVDTAQIFKAAPTLPDRRGFLKSIILPVGAALTTSAANQVGDVFLRQHMTTPLKGTVTVMPGGLRRMPGGATVEPAELIRRGGEVIRFMNLIHPDTGGVGRDGRIMAVQYDEPTDTATVTIDNERRNFDALLARLAILAPPS